MQVHYISFSSHTMHVYYFGKSGKLWRLEFDLDGENTPLTAEMQQMVDTASAL